MYSVRNNGKLRENGSEIKERSNLRSLRLPKAKLNFGGFYLEKLTIKQLNN